MGYLAELVQLSIATGAGKTDGYRPEEQESLFLQAVWAAVPWAEDRGELSGVIWGCHCGFLAVQKDVRGLA